MKHSPHDNYKMYLPVPKDDPCETQRDIEETWRGSWLASAVLVVVIVGVVAIAWMVVN